MKLVKVRIKEFQCIRDSKEFSTEDITCFVGKNESGKTAILQALYKLNPVIAEHGDFDPDSDYPRLNYSKFAQDNDAIPVIEAIFELEKCDTDILGAMFGKHSLAINNKEVELTKGYDNDVKICGIEIDEVLVLKHLIEMTGINDEEINALAYDNNFTEVYNYIHSNYDTDDIFETIKIIESISDNGAEEVVYDTILEKCLPKFMYFDEYYQIKGQESLDRLASRVDNSEFEDSDYPLVGLFELAELDIVELLHNGSSERIINKLEVAAAQVKDKILEHWSQNDSIKLQIRIQQGRSDDPYELQDSLNIFFRIVDTRYDISTSLGRRSKGFLWFFSFLTWYRKLCADHSNLILLLDEPGLSLHASAQSDLLTYLENELNENHQILYTTHSPFMINPKKIDRVRIVQNTITGTSLPKDIEEQSGTEVISDVLAADSGAIFPLQGALGYEITQSLFIGSNCLVVEGVSDMLYLQSVSAFLQSRGFPGLNDSWTITPVGGISKVSTFVSLLGYQKDINIAVVLDYSRGEANQIENLYKQKLLQENNVIIYSMFVEIEEASIEDLFYPSTYLKLINKVFGLSLKASELPRSNKVGILDRLSKLANENSSISNALSVRNGRFNHYRPAEYFMKGFDCSTLQEKELKRFEQLFASINKLCN